MKAQSGSDWVGTSFLGESEGRVSDTLHASASPPASSVRHLFQSISIADRTQLSDDTQELVLGHCGGGDPTQDPVQLIAKASAVNSSGGWGGGGHCHSLRPATVIRPHRLGLSSRKDSSFRRLG